MLPWHSLPAEVRMLTLGQVICVSTRVAPYASVCRDWQCFFEKHTFQQLVLDTPALSTFAKFVKGNKAHRLSYIKHVILRIQLSNYSCLTCSKPEDATAITRNNRIFTSSLRQLLRILSSAQGPGGLTLEISAHSPSDLKHRFHELEMEESYPFRFESDLSKSPSLLEYRRQRFQEVQDKQISHGPNRTSFGQMQRLYGTPLELRPWFLTDKRGRPNPVPTLPQVPIVKGLLIRQHFFRGIALPTLAKILRESLIGLKWFRLERWTSLTNKVEREFYKDLKTHLIPAMPQSLETFYLNQWSRWAMRRYNRVTLRSNVQKSLAKAMAKLCHRLVDFYAPPNINLKEFLYQLTQRSDGSRLERLCLVIGKHPASYSQEWINSILEDAVGVAWKMPQLRILEIWNRSLNFSYIFRYTLSNHQATITWETAGASFHLTPKVRKYWDLVASRHTTRPLAIMTKSLPQKTGAACFFGNLVLRRHVYDPIREETGVAERILQAERRSGVRL
ncbi:F-box domain-containing [Fusarium albosuccineum]|uniref:F-box domain-containing n=1 Tax=Fusarium albosuccineum TaxID=1237068 RepID=A0A8H4LRA6_9HYPO|nr:F-box domain-containing [Fusarium albosuccineum]